MALIHRAMLTRGQLDLLRAWLPSPPWFPADAGIESLGAYRFDDPAVEVVVEGLDGQPAAVEVAAYRIVSEALTNVVEHAHAARATVRVLGGPTTLEVTVSGDGRGIGDDVVAGVGLLSMRERAEELGGVCAVRSPAEGGTSVHTVLRYGAGVDRSERTAS